MRDGFEEAMENGRVTYGQTEGAVSTRQGSKVFREGGPALSRRHPDYSPSRTASNKHDQCVVDFEVMGDKPACIDPNILRRYPSI